MAFLPPATSTEVGRQGAPVAVLPVGSFEQHGAYLPLSTDTVIASVLAREIATAYDLFLLPPITISCSQEHADFPGTVSIRASTLYAMVTDIAASLERSGITKLAIISGHGGNYVLSNVAQETSLGNCRVAIFPGHEDWQRAERAAELVTTADQDMHAGEREASILLHYCPELVRPGFDTADHLADDRPHLLSLGMRPYAPQGVVGLPSAASADKGKFLIESFVASFDGYLRALLESDAH